MKSLYCLVLCSVLLASCSPASSADVIATSVAGTVAAQQPAQQEQLSSPLAPTATRQPTLTAALTKTPKPTDIPKPTSTPKPTYTLTPPPEPVILTGSGDSVVDVDWDGIGLVHVIYTGPSNFAIINYDANNERIDLLVNTIGNYEGTLPFDFLEDEDTARFEVTASGNWEIQILPVNQIRRVDIPGTFTGTGDDVVAFMGLEDPDLLVIDASKADSNFVVFSYNGGKDLLVNEIAPYTGTVIVSREAVILQIIAEGDWSIEVKTQ
jgi:hypothetical protein